MGAVCHQLGLVEAVLGHAVWRPGGHNELGAIGLVVVVHRADGDREGIIARSKEDAAGARPGGGHDGDAAGPHLLHHGVEGAVVVALRHRRGEREVGDADVEAMLVGLVDPLQAVDHVALVDVAVVVGDLDADQQAVGRDTDVLAAGVESVAGYDAGDVGPVAEVVKGIRGLGVSGHRQQAVTAVGRHREADLGQVVMREYPRVEHGHLGVAAVKALVPGAVWDGAESFVTVGQPAGVDGAAL